MYKAICLLISAHRIKSQILQGLQQKIHGPTAQPRSPHHALLSPVTTAWQCACCRFQTLTSYCSALAVPLGEVFSKHSLPRTSQVSSAGASECERLCGSPWALSAQTCGPRWCGIRSGSLCVSQYLLVFSDFDHFTLLITSLWLAKAFIDHFWFRGQ